MAGALLVLRHIRLDKSYCNVTVSVTALNALLEREIRRLVSTITLTW